MSLKVFTCLVLRRLIENRLNKFYPSSLSLYSNKWQVTSLDLKKISNTNRQLLDLRATSVKEQAKLQPTDGAKEQETPRPQTGHESVRLTNKAYTNQVHNFKVI